MGHILISDNNANEINSTSTEKAKNDEPSAIITTAITNKIIMNKRVDAFSFIYHYVDYDYSDKDNYNDDDDDDDDR